jgi:hypothetical protein
MPWAASRPAPERRRLHLLVLNRLFVTKRGELLWGRPKGVASQASDLHRREIGITLFDCPRNISHLAV